MKPILLTLMTLALVACDQQGSKTGIVKDDPIKSLWIETLDGKRHDFQVELAVTEAQQAKGLMNRTELAPMHGMLFAFGTEAERFFWMKNTLIPLDIIFIEKDGTIHHIKRNALPNDMSTVPSNGPVYAALEINGGEAAELGIDVGDIVHHTVFSNY